MATKKQPPEKLPSRAQFAFVRYELTAVELREVKEWRRGFDELDAVIIPLVDRAYKFVAKYDDFNNCYQCMMMTDNKVDNNYNLGLVGRGSSPLKALKQVLWKHRSCDGVWPAPDFSGKSPAEFDD